MPYIPENRRLDDAETAGELSYMFVITINDYIRLKKESYQTYNDIIGALESVKLEIYRRLVTKYEDKKIIENGDVFPEKIT